MSYIDIKDLSDSYDPIVNATYTISISEEIGLEGANKIAGLFNGRKISQLTLHNANLSSESVAVIAKALESVNSHITVFMSDNKIDDAGAKALAEALKNKNVGLLSLDGNEIGDEGARALAATLSANKTTYLFLKNNKIGPSGAEALTKAWATRSYTIDLSGNQLGDEGAKRVALALQATPGKVQTLYLKNNGIGLEGDLALAEHLPHSVKDITYRTEKLPYEEYSKRHPHLTGFLALVFFPFSLFTLPFMDFDEDVPGLINARVHTL